MNKNRLVSTCGKVLSVVVAAVVLLSTQLRSVAAESSPSPGRTWKTVDELSSEERRDIDLRTETPRDAQIAYLPAEAYPFTAPYTAEEMGYRLMEFTQRPRWSCAFANLWGSITSQGVLLNPGKSITFMNYLGADGVKAELLRNPGEELYRYMNQNTFPPDMEGSQRMTIRYRTDHTFTKKEEAFMYSPAIRRVRHQAPFRRQDRFPNQAQTSDDANGRDAWEFSWRIVGTDVLYQTVRFPVTRPTLVIGNTGDGTLREVSTSDLKIMGKNYPHYRSDGGVDCYVVEARAREDWLPNYYAPRMLYWLEKSSFYPLRVEQYGPDGKLAFVEVRMTEMFNPGMGERGYGPMLITYWHIGSDVLTYNVRDNHRLKTWSPEEQEVFFNPDFMRRQWYLDTSMKSQMEISHPDLFYLRPALEEGKFPQLRPLELPAEVAASVAAQNAAGRLVFEVNKPTPVATTVVKPTPAVDVNPQPTATTAGVESSSTYAQSPEQTPPAVVR
jgi:hypothetical protein